MTTRDIILRAEQYANKENADFYSYAEKVAMLNESYASLYQYLLNTGDNYWVKEISSSRNVIALPDDCYQISGLYVKIGNDRKQVYDYELKNNKIYAKQTGSKYILDYYPAPLGLTYKDDVRKCPFNMDGLTDVNSGTVLITGETYYSVYDTVTKKTYDTPLEVGEWAHTYDDGNIVAYKNGEYKCLSIGSNQVIPLGRTLIIYNNSVYYYKDNAIVDVNGNTVKSGVTLEEGTYVTDLSTFIDKVEGILPINNRTYISPDTRTAVTDGNKVYTRFSIRGYYDNALISYNAVSSTYFIECIYNDVEICYPNNVFYTVLALDVALKMRSKQGVDNNLLEQQYVMARTALFNSIEKNKGSHVKIKDVYEDYGLFSGIYY